MSSKSEKDRQKAVQDKCQHLLNEMLRDEDNKYCVDCDAKGPRWASWNLGIFLCIRCAGIHRNLGVHISKVKSVNLDTWTPEQVVSLQQMGNSRARAVYEANLPDNFRRPQTDSPLEAFVRAKYEQKKYIAREWVPPPIPKVNWDKEIEEEEQARRRRKENKNSSSHSSRTATASPGGHSITSEIPAPLPKPKSSASPKPSRTSISSVSSTSSANTSANTSGTLDLLGLDTPTGNTSATGKGDDIFSGFLSAPVAGNAPNTSTAAPGSAPGDIKADTSTAATDGKRSAEEDSFFNQQAPSTQEKKQLTKDSILALYSTVPSSTTGPQPQPQTFAGIPGSVFPAQSIAGFGTNTAPGINMSFPMSNGMMVGQSMPAAATNVQNGVFGATGSSVVGSQTGMVPPSMISNPFFSMAGTVPTQSNAFPAQNQMSQEHGSSSDLLDLGVMPRPMGSQLPQQMNRLNLGGPAVGTPNMFGGGPQGTVQQGMVMPNMAGNPWATATQQNMNMGMGMGQATFPQGQAPVGHTLATNLWQ